MTDLGINVDTQRKALNDQETRGLELGSQKRNLLNMLEKLKAEVRKSSKAINVISEGREVIRASLNRGERVRSLLEDASAEISYALRIAME